MPGASPTVAGARTPTVALGSAAVAAGRFDGQQTSNTKHPQTHIFLFVWPLDFWSSHLGQVSALLKTASTVLLKIQSGDCSNYITADYVVVHEIGFIFW
jgi:hypothetical protein